MSRRPAFPPPSGSDVLDAIAALPADVSVLLIEHDMDVVFSIRAAHLGAGRRRLAGRGDRPRRSRQIRGCARSISARPRMAELLRSAVSAPAMAGPVVLSDIAFRLAEGEALAVLGRNGVGKTTLDRQHRRRDPALRGSLGLAGREIAGLAPEARAAAGIGWVPQERNIFRSLTVQENISAVARPGPWTHRPHLRAVPRLGERPHQSGGALSGGEQQMLAIGRALALNPRLLLLDEPTEGLAPIIIEELLRALRRLFREERMAGIVVEQHAHKILPITDRAIVLDRGRIVFEPRARRCWPTRRPWSGISA
jgi:branched-chain amino acid transport system ATP-binding protein